MQLPKVELDVFETILARRSIRSYLTQKVETSKLRIMLEAAIWAPTAMHREPWGFVIVQDTQVLNALSDRAKPLFLEHLRSTGCHIDGIDFADSSIFYDASTLIIICAKKDGSFGEADCWMAAENLMLAACAMGLGTCVIGASILALDTAEDKSILGIADEFDVVAPIIVGYPRGDPAVTKRKRPLILNRL